MLQYASIRTKKRSPGTYSRFHATLGLSFLLNTAIVTTRVNTSMIIVTIATTSVKAPIIILIASMITSGAHGNEWFGLEVALLTDFS